MKRMAFRVFGDSEDDEYYNDLDDKDDDDGDIRDIDDEAGEA